MLWTPNLKVLTKVDPRNTTVCTYAITEKESCYAVEELETKLCRL